MRLFNIVTANESEADREALKYLVKPVVRSKTQPVRPVGMMQAVQRNINAAITFTLQRTTESINQRASASNSQPLVYTAHENTLGESGQVESMEHIRHYCASGSFSCIAVGLINLLDTRRISMSWLSDDEFILWIAEIPRALTTFIERCPPDRWSDTAWIYFAQRRAIKKEQLPKIVCQNRELMRRICLGAPLFLNAASETFRSDLAVEIAGQRPWASIPLPLRHLPQVCAAAGRRPCGCKVEEKYKCVRCRPAPPPHDAEVIVID